MNVVNLVGNLGGDPETFTGGQGTTVVTLNLATSRGFGDKKTTDWHTVKLFGKTAELAAEHLKKGQQVGITGKVAYESWNDKTDGKKRTKTVILGDQMHFINGRNNDGAKAANTALPNDSNIPF